MISCYYDKSVYTSPDNTEGVTGLTTAELALEASYEDWDFTDVWKMDYFFGRPILQTMPEALGTTEDPHLIPDVKTFVRFRDSVNNGNTYENQFISLTADIDLSDTFDAVPKSWSPIGDFENPFKGTFDGGGHTISNLYIYDAFELQGLFGYIDGTVKNLDISGTITEVYQAGGICGENDGTIENCRSFVKIIDSYGEVGGICGKNNGTISDCCNKGAVNGYSNVGGICGYNFEGKITKCYNRAFINAYYKSRDQIVGGVCGYNEFGNIGDCYNLGNVSSEDGDVGGVCAYNFLGNIINCYNMGAITGKNHSAGGVCGINTGYMENCYYNKDVYTAGSGENGGKGLTTAEFALQESFSNWDFTAVWAMDEFADRPQFIGRPDTGVTEADPYLIFDVKGLEAFRDKVNKGHSFEGKYIRLEADIDLSGVCGAELKSWIPIGNAEFPFEGTFDGGNHIIRNLYINDTTMNYTGLFGAVAMGTIKNLGVTGTVSSGSCIGGICGELISGTIENCYMIGAVSSSSSGSVGGICGFNYGLMEPGIIRNCYHIGTVSSSYIADLDFQGNSVGGMCGVNSDTIENCYQMGAVSAVKSDVGTYNLGGVCGKESAHATISNCYYNADLYTEEDSTGAIGRTTDEFTDQTKFIGWDFTAVWVMDAFYGRPQLRENPETAGTEEDPHVIPDLLGLKIFRDSVNRGNPFEDVCVRLTTDLDLSGEKERWIPVGSDARPFKGSFDGGGFTISNLYIKTSSDNQGLFGYLDGGSIEKLGVTGTVSGGSNIGILCGYSSGNILNCYTAGEASGSGAHTGGVCGINSGSMTNCCSIAAVSGNDSVGGVCGGNAGAVANSYYNRDMYPEQNTTDGVTGKNTLEFMSGEVAYLLQQGQSAQVWGQKLSSANRDAVPVLTDETADQVLKVTFAIGDDMSYAVSYANTGQTVTLPDEPYKDGYLFTKWSQTDAADGEEFTADTPVTADMIVYAVGQEQYGETDGKKSVTTVYGTSAVQDLSEFVRYGGGTEAVGKFTYTIKSGNNKLKAAVAGDMLTIPSDAPAGTYTLNISASEKSPAVSLFSLNTNDFDFAVHITVKPKDINDTTTAEISDFIYTGNAHTPAVTVMDGETPLTKFIDYTTVYLNNVRIGTANIIITGIGNYTGSKTVHFNIIPGDGPDAPQPEKTPTLSIDYRNEKLTGFDGLRENYLITIEDRPDETVPVADDWGIQVFGVTLSIRKIGDGKTTIDSFPQILEVPARPAAVNVTASAVTSLGRSDGKIIGVTAAMEYKLSVSEEWIDCTGTEITGLASGTYEVRIKATDNNFSSESASVCVDTECVKITAKYSIDGILLDVKFETVNISEITVPHNTQTDRIFYWENLENIVPIDLTAIEQKEGR